MFVRAETKVLDGLARVLRAAQQQGVRAGRRSQRQLIQRQALSAGSEDPRAHGGGEAQGGNGQLGHQQQPVVVRHRADDDDRLVLVLFDGVPIRCRRHDPRDAHRRPVRARHEQPAQDGLVEGRVGPACAAAG